MSRVAVSHLAATRCAFCLTFFVLSQCCVPRRHWQIIPALWVRVWGLNRAGFTIVERAWSWLAQSSCRGYPLGEITDELLLSCTLALLRFCDLRRNVSGEVTCFDASRWASAVCVSSALTKMGMWAAGRCGRAAWQPAEDEVTIFSAFQRYRLRLPRMGSVGIAGGCKVRPPGDVCVQSAWALSDSSR